MQQKTASQPNIYFVRHGQSVANLESVVAGSGESPLTEVGVGQAYAEADIILQKEINFDKIITSPISRAFDTACIIARQIGFDEKTISITDLLKERNVGGFEGKTQNEFKSASEADKEAAGCETLIALYERVVQANEFILNAAKESENVLVVGHSGFYRMARCVAEALEPEATYGGVEEPKNSTLLEYPLWQA